MRTIVEMKLAQVVRRLHQHYGLETEINDSLYDQLCRRLPAGIPGRAISTAS